MRLYFVRATSKAEMAKLKQCKYMKRKILWLSILFFISTFGWAQQLNPGFNKQEYLDLLSITAHFGDSSYQVNFPPPPEYTLAYSSSIMGLDNKWELYTKGNDLAVISLRGTTEKSESWLANLYAAMVPASGELKISQEETFSYHLADNPKAAVHVGWLVSTAFLAKDILPKIDSSYQAGIKDMLITGHSQGGAIAYLLTAHLYSLQEQGLLPADIRFKTYCSAGPKPGNLYFAYDYEAKTQNGWAFNVVNSADWVPEVPVSIQTVDDFNDVNPFQNIGKVIKKQKLVARVAMKHAYNKLYKPTRRARKNYQKILGEITSKSVGKAIPGFVAPEYYQSNDYVRTGTTIVLQADQDYYQLFPDDAEKIFMHHLHQPYLYLAEKLNFNSSFSDDLPKSPALEGDWEMVYITGRRIAFQGLYPDRKPVITFDSEEMRISGNTSCNSFNGPFEIKGNHLDIGKSLAATKMFCPGEGEMIFLEALQQVDAYGFKGKELLLMKGDLTLMRFRKK